MDGAGEVGRNRLSWTLTAKGTALGRQTKDGLDYTGKKYREQGISEVEGGFYLLGIPWQNIMQ